MPRPRFLWTAVTVALAARSAAEEAGSPRRQLERMEQALAEAVSTVSRPAAISVLGAADSCRGYRLQGVGAWFVVSPRSLPDRPAARTRPDPDLAEADAALATAITGLEQGLTAAPTERDKQTLRGGLQQLRSRQRDLRKRVHPISERELKAWEDRAWVTHVAAEEARGEAEAALRILEEMLGRAAAPAFENERAAEAEREETLPPWRVWVHSGAPEDPRPPEVLLQDVREAVARTIEEHGPGLVLRSEEMIAVAVDFFRPSPLACSGQPTRTLVVRVPMRVLEAREAGRLTAEEARRQFEIAEY